MKRVLILVLLAAVSVGLVHGQKDEQKKEYFTMLDSALDLAGENNYAAALLCNELENRYGGTSDILLLRGILLSYGNDLDGAFKLFKKGSEIWKKDAYFRVGVFYKAMANILMQIGDAQNAIEVASKGIKRDKKFYILYYQRGECYHELGQYKKAIADYKKSCEDKDYFCDAMAEIAMCYAEQGNAAEASKALEKSLHENNYHGESRRLKALIALSKYDFEGFIDDYLMYMQINKPTEPMYIFGICEDKKYYDYALGYAKEILEGQEDSLNVAYWEWVISKIEISTGNESEMWKHAQRAKEMNPGNTTLDTKIWFQYATHYSINDDMENLLVALDTLIIRDSISQDGNYNLHTLKARILKKQNRYNEAVTSYKNALKMGIEDQDERKVVFYNLADLYVEQLKDATKAIEYFDSVLVIDPSMTPVMYQKGKAYQKMAKDTAKAFEVFEQIIRIESEKDEVGNDNYTQFALAQMGRFEEAEAFQKRVDDYAATADAEKKIGLSYNAACLYSIIGKKDIAVEKLMDAMNEGILSCQQMKDDEDFDNIRETEGYKAIEKMICSAEE